MMVQIKCRLNAEPARNVPVTKPPFSVHT